MGEAAGPDFGKQISHVGLAYRGWLIEADWRRFLIACANAMGMTPAGECGAWHYPDAGGKGGVGMTLMQPITESFLALDTWSDHDGAYLFIASCRHFAVEAIDATADRFGLVRIDASPLSVLKLS